MLVAILKSNTGSRENISVDRVAFLVIINLILDTKTMDLPGQESKLLYLQFSQIIGGHFEILIWRSPDPYHDYVANVF